MSADKFCKSLIILKVTNVIAEKENLEKVLGLGKNFVRELSFGWNLMV